MAQLATTFSTYGAVDGINEELDQMIYSIDPEETPFVSSIGRGSVSNTYYEWLTDSLAAAVSTNFQIEGDNYTTHTAATGRVRLGNFTCISKKDVIVSGTQRAVDNAGVSDELGYQIAKMGKELRLDMEKILTGPQAAVAGNDTTARETAGFEAFIRTNDDRGATGVQATLSGTTKGYPSVDVVDGTQRAFSEVIHKAVNAMVWTSGGKAERVIVGPVNKARASTFTGIAAQRHEVGNSGQATIMGAADVYLGDFGRTYFIPSRLSRERSALYVDPAHATLVTLRNFQMLDIAKTGDADKGVLIVEYGLKIDTEKAHGIAADLTTT